LGAHRFVAPFHEVVAVMSELLVFTYQERDHHTTIKGNCKYTTGMALLG